VLVYFLFFFKKPVSKKAGFFSLRSRVAKVQRFRDFFGSNFMCRIVEMHGSASNSKNF
jgi:hypothetical protein